jgi:epoxyqueuosine reductase
MSAASATERVKRMGQELGFARVGIARAERLDADAARLDAWLAAGHHGDMEYMQRTAKVRVDPTDPGMLPEARSVIVLAAAYGGAGTSATLAPGRIARYARGRDYHNVLHRRLRKLTADLRQSGHHARAAVDSMPVLERAWAQRAGVGFIGKNCCLIVPGLGSHVFLCAVITSAALEPDAPLAERCGECRLCLDHCPTAAFTAARSLDARRCISYLTIEHRGAIAAELRPLMGEWMFGCDACQDICPFNRGAGRHAGAHDSAFSLHSRFEDHDAQAVLAMDDAQFERFAEGSPLRRAKREGMARNAALVLGNARERRALPILRDAASGDPSAIVRDAANWAIDRIEKD